MRQRRRQRVPGDAGVQACAEQGKVLAAQADGVRVDRAWPFEGAAFERILASLHEAALDLVHWSGATALIDEALQEDDSSMVLGDGGSDEDIRIYFAWDCFGGQRDRERWSLENDYALDERVPRLRHLPDSKLVQVTDLYTEEELKTTAACNEALARGHARNSISVRLVGARDSRID